MATFLFVLKIIGIVLLCILALILLILLLVLFVPVRYKIKGQYDGKPYIKGRITYLLALFGVTATYTDALKVILRLIFIPIKLYPRKKKAKKSRDNGKAEEAEATGTDTGKNESSESSEASGSEDEPKPDTGDKDKNKRKGHKVGKADEPEEPEVKLSTVDKIKAYADLLTDPETVAAWDVCKYRLGKLLKVLIPKHIDIRVRYGLEDPYMTSVIMSVYNVFYIYLGGGLTIEPVYDHKTVEAYARIKGYIMTAPVLWQVIMVILNKDCRRFLKRFKSIK